MRSLLDMALLELSKKNGSRYASGPVSSDQAIFKQAIFEQVSFEQAKKNAKESIKKILEGNDIQSSIDHAAVTLIDMVVRYPYPPSDHSINTLGAPLKEKLSDYLRTLVCLKDVKLLFVEDGNDKSETFGWMTGEEFSNFDRSSGRDLFISDRKTEKVRVKFDPEPKLLSRIMDTLTDLLHDYLQEKRDEAHRLNPEPKDPKDILRKILKELDF